MNQQGAPILVGVVLEVSWMTEHASFLSLFPLSLLLVLAPDAIVLMVEILKESGFRQRPCLGEGRVMQERKTIREDLPINGT